MSEDEELDLTRAMGVAVAYVTMMRGKGGVDEAFMGCLRASGASPAAVLVQLGDIAFFALRKLAELEGEDSVDRYLQELALEAHS